MPRKGEWHRDRTAEKKNRLPGLCGDSDRPLCALSLPLFSPGQAGGFQPGAYDITGADPDTGHGGEDGGAVSAAGVPESDINLQIVQKLELLFAFTGQTISPHPQQSGRRLLSGRADPAGRKRFRI